MKLRVLILLFGVAIIAIIFRFFDSGLSGGSATNAMVPIGIAIACGILAIIVIAGSDEVAALVGRFAAFAPFLLLGYCALASNRWDNRPETLERRTLADNILCATNKAGFSETDEKFIRYRVNIIRKWGDAPNGHQRDIEQKLKITILPNCSFERWPTTEKSNERN